MSIFMTGTDARLEGDWTLSGVSRNLDSLASCLQQLESGVKKKLRIDCGQMKEADINGLQLLNVWMQCARFRGFEPTLINVPERLRHAMQALIERRIIDACPDRSVLAG